MHIIDIWVNCPSIETADAISDALLQAKLVAAANRYPAVESAYVWEGVIERAEEYPLRLKTRADLGQRVEDEIRKHHPYEVPCILRADVAGANSDYISWVYEATRTP